MKTLQTVIRGIVFCSLAVALLWLPSLFVEFIMTTWLAWPIIIISLGFICAMIYYIFKELVFGEEEER